MDKKDHDAILNAYNLARERLAKKKADSGLVEDALQQSMVNVIKARARVKDVPAYALRTVYRELTRLAKLQRRLEQKQRLPRRSSTQSPTWAGKTAFTAASWPGN